MVPRARLRLVPNMYRRAGFPIRSFPGSIGTRVFRYRAYFAAPQAHCNFGMMDFLDRKTKTAH